jgi:hypothetical protein
MKPRLAFLSVCALLVLVLPLGGAAGEGAEWNFQGPAASGLENERQATEAEWLRTAGDYRKSLEKALALYRQEFRQRADRVAQLKEFYERKLIARVELEESQRSLGDLEAKLAEFESRIAELDLAIGMATVRAKAEAPPVAESPKAGVFFHYEGKGLWSLAILDKVESFFAGEFGRPLPVSAWGQTALHDRLQLDHRNAVDVAVHPDSPEGRALMAHLRSKGIPFIAFRSPVAGSATGAHIHIGPPSLRLSATVSLGR